MGREAGPGLLVVWEEERVGCGKLDLEGRGTVGLRSRLKAELHHPIPNSIPGPWGWSLSKRWGRGEERISRFKTGGWGRGEY